METIGLILFATLFLFAAKGHLLNSKEIGGYAATAFGDCPVSKQLSYLAGWPTGLYLLFTGFTLAFVDSNLGLWLAAGFLVPATALYHRDLKDSGTWKNIALLGAALALIAG